jgi:hypothetical protein
MLGQLIDGVDVVADNKMHGSVWVNIRAEHGMGV